MKLLCSLHISNIFCSRFTIAAKSTFSWYFPSSLLGTDGTVWSCPWTGNEAQAHSDPDVEDSVTRNNCSAANPISLCFPLKTRLTHINVSETVLACSKLTLNSDLLLSQIQFCMLRTPAGIWKDLCITEIGVSLELPPSLTEQQQLKGPPTPGNKHLPEWSQVCSAPVRRAKDFTPRSG